MASRTRARRRALFAIGTGLVLAVAAASAVFALSSSFEYGDGNSLGTADWDGVYAGAAGFDATAFTQDPDYTKEASLFTGGSKDVLDIPQWAWRTVGQAPDKSDLLDVMSAKQGNLLYFAADRYATNGDTKVGFWFLQDDVSYKYDTSTFTGQHINGDIMIESNFTNGGKIDAIKVYEWTDGTLAERTDVLGGDCTDDSGSFKVCATNNTTQFAPAWPYQQKRANKIAKGAFLEGALDLSAIYPAGIPCFGSFIAETRASGSGITSELKDLVLSNFDTCGSLTIQKVRNAGSPDDTFSFTTGGTLSPDTFDLKGATSLASVGAANRQSYIRLVPGTYTVAELAPADPWVLTNIVCTGGTASTDGSYTATITISGTENVVCTYYNFYNVVTTRTQGFWQTHPNLAAASWATAVKTECLASVTAIDGDHTDQLMGGFWSNVASKVDGTKRLALDKSRMTLLQQLLAAMLNRERFGTTEAMSTQIDAAVHQFCSPSNQGAVNAAASAMGAYNQSGDTGIWSPGERATAVDARSRANLTYWDVLP